MLSFKLLLSFTLFLVLYDVAPAIAQSTKGSFNNTVSFPSIGFRKDTLHATKRSVWGESAVFTVNGEKNREWKVSALPQFGLYGLQIKATPMLEMLVDSTFGEAVAGIQLEPSGTVFSEPITINLTIEEELAKSPVIFFMTDDSGNLTEIVNQKHEGNNYTLEVTHFSGLAGIVPVNMENICLISAAATSASIDRAKALLTNNPRITVEPVSFERKCDEEYSRLLRVNIAQMMEPERSAISDILSYHRGVALTCTVSDLKELHLPVEVYKLSDQLVAKALNAIAEYKNQPDKFAAVGQFALIASRENSLLGSPNAAKTNQMVFEALSDWIQNNIKYYKKKIAEEHDFQYIRTLTDSYASLSLIAPEISSFEDMIGDLENLLRFDLEIAARVYRDCQGGDWTSNEYTITEGTANMEFNFEFYNERRLFPSPNYSQRLIGTGTFLTEGKAVRNGQEETDISTVVSDDFEKKYEIQLNFCELKGETTCASPGNPKEEWEGDEFINSSLRQIRFTNTFFNMLNRHHSNKGKFEFQIRNRQAVLVEDVHPVFQDYDHGEQKIRTEFYYKLIHKPKY